SSSISHRAWPRRSTGPSPSHALAPTSSTSAPSKRRSGRFSSTARISSASGLTVSTRSCAQEQRALPDPSSAAVAFTRVLRGAGVDVPVGAVTTYLRALDRVGVSSKKGVYWTGRATLLSHREDIATYDAV